MPATSCKIALVILCSAFVLGGCSKATLDSGVRANAGNSWTKHGVLRIGNVAEPDTLNPLVGNEQIDSDLAMFWGGFLFNYSDRNEYVPELATELPTLHNGGISPDGLTVTYHLRRGVTWQDGAPFSARDVVFTWRAVMNKNNNIQSTVGFEIIRDISVPNPYAIEVHLKHSWAPFVATFFNQSLAPFPILPAHLLSRYPNLNQSPFNSQPVGTGPFSVRRWERGSKIVFEANPHYWRGAPKLKRIDYEPVPNENTMLTLLQSHEIDLEFDGSANDYGQFRNIVGLRTELTYFNQFDYLAINTTAPPLDDVRIRRALWYAIDTSSLIRRISHGVDIAGYSDQPSYSWAYDPKVNHYAYDPATARRLLDSAGWKLGRDGFRTKSGTRLALTIAGATGSASTEAVDIAIQRYWLDVGIDARVKNYPTSLLFATYGAGGILQAGKFDVALQAWVGGTDPDDSALWMCDQAPPAGQNNARFCSRALDSAERLATTSPDTAIRKNAYAKVQEILNDQVPMIPIWYNRRISVYNSDLRNYRPAHAVTSFWNPWEWEI